jgi:2-dehydro-3-deoxyphosphogluconate aldolase / (4S)-4-hydroxy-2-oxoglutarate aldolase
MEELVSWTREKALARIREIGVIPIVRVASADDALRAAEALIESGIGIAEITMTVPHAVKVMEKVADKFGDKVLLGAGTVLDTETLRAALLAGAEFIVTPSLNVEVIRMARRYKKACFPGALTPTEILAAWEAGAAMVKVFPCGPVGGAKYIKAIKGPFPEIDLVPTGGVDLESAPEFIKAGASAIAVGSELVNAQHLRDGKLEEIVNTARKYIEVVRKARAPLG